VIPRLARPEDLGLVRSSWLRSYSTSDFAKYLTPPDVWRKNEAAAEYWNAQRRVIEHLLARARTEVLDDDGVLTAWCCSEPERGVVHYVYVKHMGDRRGRGLARTLLRDFEARDEVLYTHRSRNLDSKRLPAGWRFSWHSIFGEEKAA
jgi:hypothetical protein